MTDFLRSKTKILGKLKPEQIVEYTDIKRDDVIVSEHGLRALSAWYRKQPARLPPLAKTKGFVDNLLKISIEYCGPSKAQSPFNAQALVLETKGGLRVDHGTFAQSVEMVLDVMSDTSLAAAVLKDLSKELFEEYVTRLGNYVPRDINFPSQETTMDVLIRIAAQYLGKKKKEDKERFQMTITGMPEHFSKVITDPDLGCKMALEQMRPLLTLSNQENKNIASAMFTRLGYEGCPIVQKEGYVDMCKTSVIVTLNEDVHGEDRFEIPFGDLSKIHFIDDELGRVESKSIDFSMDKAPEPLKTILGLKSSQDLSQGLLNIQLHKDADIARLEKTTSRGLEMQSSLRDSQLEVEIQELVAADARKTSMATTRSSSREPSQVTPSTATAKAMATTRRAKQTARSTSVDIDRPRSNTISEGEEEGEEEREEDESPVKRDRKISASLSPKKADPKASSPPSRRSARLQPAKEETMAKGEAQADMDVDYDHEHELDLSKTAQTVQPPRMKPSRSISVSTPAVASSPAKMRRPVANKVREHEPGPPSFSQADRAMQQEQQQQLTADSLEKPAASREKRKAVPARSRLDKENVLAEGRKRAHDAESTDTVGGLRERDANAASTTAILESKRTLSYKKRDGHSRTLNDEVFLRQASSQHLFTSSEEEEEDEDDEDLYEPTGMGERGGGRQSKKRQRVSATDRRVRQRREESMEIDEGQFDDYSSPETTARGGGGGGGEEDLDITIQNLIAEISRNQMKRSQAKNERMFVVQADAAFDQVKAYLREWVGKYRGQLDEAEREIAAALSTQETVAEVQKNSLSADVVDLKSRAAELEDYMRPLVVAAESLFRDIANYNSIVSSDAAKFKAECKVRFDDLTRGLKRSAAEEGKDIKYMQKAFRGDLSHA